MLKNAAGERLNGRVLVDGSGVGMYLSHLVPISGRLLALILNCPACRIAAFQSKHLLRGWRTYPPIPKILLTWSSVTKCLSTFRTTSWRSRRWCACSNPAGASCFLPPNRGYPFETHGHYWKGKYHFGNTPLINWLPRKLRDKLAPRMLRFIPVKTWRNCLRIYRCALSNSARSWRLRQHHRAPTCFRQSPAHVFTIPRKKTPPATPRSFSFLGN